MAWIIAADNWIKRIHWGYGKPRNATPGCINVNSLLTGVATVECQDRPCALELAPI